MKDNPDLIKIKQKNGDGFDMFKVMLHKNERFYVEGIQIYSLFTFFCPYTSCFLVAFALNFTVRILEH